MENTNVARRTRPVVKASLFSRVADFAISAEVLAATYSDDVTVDGVYSAIFDSADATEDEVDYVAQGGLYGA